MSLWMKVCWAIRGPWKRRKLLRVLAQPKPAWDRDDRETGETLAELYAVRNGYDITFIPPHDWAEAFNRLSPASRITALHYPSESVAGFIDPLEPRMLVCCRQN